MNQHTGALKSDGQRILIQTIVALVGLVAGLAAVSHFFRPEMEALSRRFIDWAGVWGVGLGFMIPDALTLPIPPDTFLVAGHLGGLEFWPMTLWGGVGSVLGGTSGFLMIRALSERPTIRGWLEGKIQRGASFMERYGLLALALAALTPLPYSLVCWACGATKVRTLPFILVSLLRIPRVAVYLLIIEQTMQLSATPIPG